LSSRALVALPKNLIASLSRAGTQARQVSEALLFQQRVRARSGMDIVQRAADAVKIGEGEVRMLIALVTDAQPLALVTEAQLHINTSNCPTISTSN